MLITYNKRFLSSFEERIANISAVRDVLYECKLSLKRGDDCEEDKNCIMH